MQILSLTENLKMKSGQLEGADRRAAVAIGKFDGIHAGHKKLLEEIINAKKQGMRAVVFTFDPSPEELFLGHKIPALCTKEEKRKRFAAYGIDELIEFPLSRKRAAMDPVSFVQQILVEELNAGLIVSGTDLTFGDRGRGNAKTMQECAKLFDFSYRMIDKICLEDQEISSTRIREAVKNGEMELAERMLLEPYSVTGEIVHGKHLGHQLLMPTINLIASKEKLLPPHGVYASNVLIGEKKYRGITNIGFKPTVSNENRLGIETYLYDFTGDLYGAYAEVTLLHFMRKEQRFSNLEALKKQLETDKQNGKLYFDAI